MKSLTIATLLAIITLTSCKQEHPKNYLTLSAKLENYKDSTITIKGDGFSKEIKINAVGVFKDTMKVAKGGVFYLSKKGVPIYLNNGYDLKLTGNLEKLKFNGNKKGVLNNNFILSIVAFNNKMGNPQNLFALDKETFTNKINALKKSSDSITALYKGIDNVLISSGKQNKEMFDSLEKNYDAQRVIILKQEEAMRKLAKGNVSPKFTNYENFKGGKTSLDNLKGKYVYIDVWATWCGPCKVEIPFLKEVEKEYHGKNISFVSISLDNKSTSGSWDKAHKSWKKMVGDKNLSGIQLFAGMDENFERNYVINSIPRFILIDPQGKIVDAYAPRPSQPKLKDLFKELGI